MFELSFARWFVYYFFFGFFFMCVRANVLCDVGVGREGEDSNFVVFSVVVRFCFRAIFLFGGENASGDYVNLLQNSMLR